MHRIAYIRSILRRRPICLCGEHSPCARSRTRPYTPLNSDTTTYTYGGWQ